MAAPTLADLTTLGVGGPAAHVVGTSTSDELVAVVSKADRDGEALLVLGGGSNVVVSDAGFDGTVVQDRRSDITVTDGDGDAVDVVVAAGTVWRTVVDHAVENGLAGVEALAGIPGSAGATPVQNVGAYGQDVGQTIAAVTVWDREHGEVRSLTRDDLRLGYRTSVLKATMRDGWFPTPRYVVLDVTVTLRRSTLSEPVRYPELARTLGVAVGDRAPLDEVRDAVLTLRASKGMLLDPSDADTRSAGSFFTNPLLDADAAASLPADAPRFPAGDGLVKTSAAWLIDRSGITKGHGSGPATVSTKHVLALTNRGGASAEDVLALAREIRAAVRARFGVELLAEPVLIGCAL